VLSSVSFKSALRVTLQSRTSTANLIQLTLSGGLLTFPCRIISYDANREKTIMLPYMSPALFHEPRNLTHVPDKDMFAVFIGSTDLKGHDLRNYLLDDFHAHSLANRTVGVVAFARVASLVVEGK
jgi:hypothetical protein